MCKVHLVPGTHLIQIRVTIGEKTCDCPVTRDHNGVGIIQAPIDHDIRKQLLEMPGLIQMVRAMDPRIMNLKISES